MKKDQFEDGMKVLRGSHSPRQKPRFAYRPRTWVVQGPGAPYENGPADWADPPMVWLLPEPLATGATLANTYTGYRHSLADLIPCPE